MIKLDLRCTDCLNKIRGLKSIPSHSVKFIFVDLPYGITNAKWDSVIPLKPLWEQYKRIIKKHGCIALFGTGLFSSKLNIVGNNYVRYRYNWTWCKSSGTNFLLANKMPMNNTEEISIFYKHLPTYNPQMRIGALHNTERKNFSNSKRNNANAFAQAKYVKGRITNKYYPLRSISFSNDNDTPKKYRYHPTQKPINLLEYLIKTYTNKNDLVMDNTMGSGSTGVACILTHRRFIGMEINQHYFNIACKRISQAQNKVMHSIKYKYQQQKYQLIVLYQHELQELKSQYKASA